jgi:N-acyl-D-amino-acid deacylase
MRIIAILLAACAVSATLGAQIPDFTPQTPLVGALLHDDIAEAKRLLEQGADPNQGTFQSLSPLILAILRQDLPLVRLMAAKGADLDARDRSGSTALMWAAFNETGDSAILEELLRHGADPHATNKRGETALVWALRRGDTPAVAALRKAGASDTAIVKASVEKAIALLQRSGTQFARVSGCYSCHHQSLPMMAVALARTRGIQVDEAVTHAQAERTMAVLKSVHQQALDNRDRIPDAPIAVSYGLLGLAAQGYAPDAVTDALTRVIAAWQSDNGAFSPLPPVRPPLEASTFTATALSVRALQVYGSHQDERVARARDWLSTATPRTNEDRAMRLLGLAWAKAPADAIRTSANALLAGQQPDGGWAQLPSLETDAYATGQALVALQAAGHPTSSAAYQRGVAFLLRTQFADGSWLVRSRTFPLQPMRDSGFPHGRDQWISAAGTSWATMALSLALPEAAPIVN